MFRMTNEFKTGLMLVVVLAILGYFVYSAGDFGTSEHSYPITVLYGFISGLRENAPVRLCGAKVGKVTDIKILCGDTTQIAVTLQIKESAKIRKDAKFYISTLGLMGEKYIEISSGSKGTPFLDAGTQVRGEDPLKMEVLMSKADVIAANLNTTLIQLRSLSKHADELVTKKEIDNTLKNLEITSENFKEFSEKIKRQPWRLIWKTREKKTEKKQESPSNKNKGGGVFKKGIIQ